jgi:hypothetical protein
MPPFVPTIFSRFDLYSNGCNVLKAVVEFLFLNDGYVPRAAFNTLLSGAKLLDKIMHIPDDIEHQFR